MALPGMVNAHSHAFQRGMTGIGERAGGEASFWGWRETMYRLAARVTPRDMEAIATQAYADMIRGGFTSVVEFHYLHHLADGTATTEMAEALVAAARRTGIRLFLLPVFYSRGGFGQPPLRRQRRFVHEDVEQFLRLLERLAPHATGIAPHSLRAVPADCLDELVAGADAILGEGCAV
ncbi:MAG: amidohydrolase family protein, partial [Gammaproteobacteria bacterium]|nr:amidohydrolase family protein [Gammaproteobacteria bacterium]